MKITKTFTSVFLLTFLIGVIGYFLASESNKHIEHIEQKEIVQAISSDFSAPKIETNIQPNVFDIEHFWDDSEGKYNTNFLEVGEVSNGEDIEARTGETWFGLFNENGKDILRSTKVKIKTTKEENRIWKEVSVRDKKIQCFC